MNSAVLIKVDNQKKYTKVKYATDCPYFNEYFVFDFYTTLEKLIDKTITFTVVQPGNIIRKRKALGYVTLDIATVWNQIDHQFYHKWAILTAPDKEAIAGNRGYLRIDISVLTKGENPKIPKVSPTDEIEGNFLLPFEGTIVERQKANFIFDIYRGENLTKNQKPENPPTTFIEIQFAGSKVKTTVKKNNLSPIWNERLILSELFPPLCQRIKVVLYHLDGFKKHLYAHKYVNLRSISSNRMEGFLPTLGPTFLYFYNEEGYAGQVLLSLKTELVMDNPVDKKVNVITPAPALNEDFLADSEKIFLCVALFAVGNIGKKFCTKPVSFRMTFGDVLFQKENDESGDALFANATTAQQCGKINKKLGYFPIGDKKPCLMINTSLPDYRRGMFLANMLEKIARELTAKLNSIEAILNKSYYDYKMSKSQIDEILLESLDFIVASVEKYIDIASSYNMTKGTVLDQERLKMCMKEMESISSSAKTVYRIKSRKKSFNKIQKLYDRIEILIEEAQDWWPKIYLWMFHGNKKVANCIVEPKNIIHSLVEEEKGRQCGVLQTLYLQSPKGAIVSTKGYLDMVGQVEAIPWIGLERHKEECINNLTKGFKLISENGQTFLLAEEKYEFQCRAHIFQGRFTPGSDKTGLCDPFVSVIIDRQCRETIIINNTLIPVWDQTLIFTGITLYGSKGFIKNNLPTIFVEVYDRDECCKNELVGRTVLRPSIKMAEEPYSPPAFPPKLNWFELYSKFDVSAEILGAFEYLEVTDTEPIDKPKDNAKIAIPTDIKPILEKFRLEVCFWGVRHLKKVQLCQINRPKVVVECVNSTITSETLGNWKNYSNFNDPIKSLDVIMPLQNEYAPPLLIKMFESRTFGINIFAGVHVTHVQHFMCTPMTAKERLAKLSVVPSEFSINSDSIITIGENKLKIDRFLMGDPEKTPENPPNKWNIFKMISKCCWRKDKSLKSQKKSSSIIQIQIASDEMEKLDWWTKFYASMEIYQSELESQPEFKGFADTLATFQIYKGRRTGDEAVDEENTTGVLKGAVKIYRWPPPDGESLVTVSGQSLDGGFFQDFPSNKLLEYVLRVYCVRAIGLRPKDLNGKSDPYLCINLNGKIITDKEHCVMRQVNPVCYEFNATFPQDNTLTVSVYDWDVATTDDLIGETKIDIENRFYTCHRAHCGLARDYFTSGYCQWRDMQRPSIILESLCKKWNLPSPEYGATSVRIGFNEFEPNDSNGIVDPDTSKEVLALAALCRWQEIPVVGCHLVPEHVETRSLYNPIKPGLEQGKLQLWIDILPRSDLPIPKQVDISQRTPKDYELRVTIWNTDSIPLHDDEFFTGEKKSDIFVKGWLVGPQEAQYTDVHYRSLSGEGNFNWRMVFKFLYLSTENKLVLYEKESMFDIDKTEVKIPCKLTLQVWDEDTFSANDFLGTLSLELARFPRGATAAKKCNLSVLGDDNVVIDLFKVRRTRGWWPFMSIDPETNKEIYAGAVEAEFDLVCRDDAEKSPVGLGRNEPEPLPKPNRPDTSFSWFRNPLKALCYVAGLYKWKFLKGLSIIIIITIILMAFYAFPGYAVKKILHA